ncbi:MAG: hypothetical protein ACK421_07650 [Pseudanabaenaceae cyanobacterium]
MQINFEAWRNGWVCRNKGKFCPLPEDKKKENKEKKAKEVDGEFSSIGLAIAASIALAIDKIKSELIKQEIYLESLSFEGLSKKQMERIKVELIQRKRDWVQKIESLEAEIKALERQIQSIKDAKESKRLKKDLAVLEKHKAESIKILSKIEVSKQAIKKAIQRASKV